MFANYWGEVEIARQRRYFLMQQAEQERLVDRVPKRRFPTLIALRMRLGAWLVVAGRRLQTPPSLRNAHEW